jgi:hypothetical protein
MRHSAIAAAAVCAALILPAAAKEAAPPDAAGTAGPEPAKVLEKHREGSADVAGKQDELSADVQQLTLEQTVPQVIELLEEVETIMDDAIDWLLEHDTGGRTIAAQTEVIEKIFEAAKQRQQQSGGSQSSGAMMDMMEKMMQRDEGKEPGEQDGKEGDKPGDKGGQGKTGEDADPSDAAGGDSAAKNEARRVPRAAGTGGATLPEEFRRALDAYNRGLEKKDK